MSILIVEDDPITTKILIVTLTKHGYELFNVQSGMSAMQFLERRPSIELVIADIMMPDMDGLTLLKKMKGTRKLKDIPVIMYSARNDKETIQKAIELGCTDYITKPRNLKELLKRISRVIQARMVVLKDKNKVRMEFSMEYKEYENLFQMFSEMAITKLSYFESEGKLAHVEDSAVSLLELKEGSLLIGAERLHGSLKRLEVSQQKNEIDVLKDDVRDCIDELKLLHPLLLGKNAQILEKERV